MIFIIFTTKTQRCTMFSLLCVPSCPSWLEKLRSQIRPAQFLAKWNIHQRLRADHILNLVRFDGARRGGAQDVNHFAREDFSGSDVARSAQATTLHNLGLLLVARNKFIRRAESAFELTRFLDHVRPIGWIQRKLVIGAFTAVVV